MKFKFNLGSWACSGCAHIVRWLVANWIDGTVSCVCGPLSPPLLLENRNVHSVCCSREREREYYSRVKWAVTVQLPSDFGPIQTGSLSLSLRFRCGIHKTTQTQSELQKSTTRNYRVTIDAQPPLLTPFFPKKSAMKEATSKVGRIRCRTKSIISRYLKKSFGSKAFSLFFDGIYQHLGKW